MLIAISGLTTEAGWFNWLSRKRGSAGAGKDEAARQLVQAHNYVPIAFADPLKRILKDVFDFTDDQLWGPSENRNKEDPRYPRNVFGGSPLGSCPLVHSKEDPTPVGLTVRHALQTLGDGWGRNECYEPIWAEYAIRMTRQLATGKFGYDQKLGLYPFSGTPSSIDPELQCSGVKGGPVIIGVPRTDVVITDLRYQNEAEAVRKAGGKLVRVKRKVKEIKVSPDHKSENDLLNLHDDDFDWVLNNNSTLTDLWARVDRMVEGLKPLSPQPE
jgi:hypothetical protein